jgi:hypothetical protein
MSGYRRRNRAKPMALCVFAVIRVAAPAAVAATLGYLIYRIAIWFTTTLPPTAGGQIAC